MGICLKVKWRLMEMEIYVLISLQFTAFCISYFELHPLFSLFAIQELCQERRKHIFWRHKDILNIQLKC